MPNSSWSSRSGRKPALAESRSRRRRCTWHARVMQVACNKPATIMQRCHASLMPSSCKIPSKYHAKIHLSIMPSSCKIPTLGTVLRCPQVPAVFPHAAVQPLVLVALGAAAQARTARGPLRAPARRNRAIVAVGHGSAAGGKARLAESRKNAAEPKVLFQAGMGRLVGTKEPRRDWKTALETDGRHKVRMARIKTWTRRSRATATRPRARGRAQSARGRAERRPRRSPTPPPPRSPTALPPRSPTPPPPRRATATTANTTTYNRHTHDVN